MPTPSQLRSPSQHRFLGDRWLAHVSQGVRSAGRLKPSIDGGTIFCALRLSGLGPSTLHPAA